MDRHAAASQNIKQKCETLEFSNTSGGLTQVTIRDMYHWLNCPKFFIYKAGVELATFAPKLGKKPKGQSPTRSTQHFLLQPRIRQSNLIGHTIINWPILNSKICWTGLIRSWYVLYSLHYSLQLHVMVSVLVWNGRYLSKAKESLVWLRCEIFTTLWLGFIYKQYRVPTSCYSTLDCTEELCPKST